MLHIRIKVILVPLRSVQSMVRSYGVGLTLRIPIFDGLDKTYKIKKAMIDIENKDWHGKMPGRICKLNI